MLMTSLLPYLDSYPNIGATFSAKRLELGMSMDNISERLGVSRFYVIGLESNRIDLLPTVAETRDLITYYSQQLKLDSQPILKQFDTWHVSCPISKTTQVNVKPSIAKNKALKAAIMASLLFFVPTSTHHLMNTTELTITTVDDPESNIATLKFTAQASANDTPPSYISIKPTEATFINEFAPKPYSDTRNADDIERDRLFYLQEQLRLGVEPVAMPYRG